MKHWQMRRGQLFKFPVIVMAFFSLLFIHILIYFLLSLNGFTQPLTLHQATGVISGQPANPFISTALSAYLRTPLSETLDTPSALLDTTTAVYLTSHQDLWKGKTYGEFVSLLTSSESDPAQLSTTFESVTKATFSPLAPSGKRFTLRIGSNREPIMADVGSIQDLERQARDQRTAELSGGPPGIGHDDLELLRTAKDYEEFISHHTSKRTIASLAPDHVTIELFILYTTQEEGRA